MRPPHVKKSRKEIYQEEYDASKQGGEWFFPQVVSRDAIVAFLVVMVIIALAVILPATSQLPADPTSTTYIPRPEWYFLFFFQFLKLFPGSLEPLAAAIIPIVALIILFLVPFLDRGQDRRWSKRKKPIAAGALVLAVLIVLEVVGALSAPAVQPEANPLVVKGLAVYNEINCAYCHSINGVGGAIGPDLSNIASKLTKDQITTYLQNPDLMVPNTLHPKLQFTPDELNALTAYLETLGPIIPYSPQAPQLFAQNCAACHSINGVGGTAGPDLSREGALRSIDFLDSFITDSKSVNASSTMPAFKNILTPDQIRDIAAYLYSLKGATPTTSPTTTSTPTSTPTTSTTSTPATTSTTINASQLYSTYCASCHGANRQGGKGPALTASALSGSSTSQVALTITDGFYGMPSFSSQMTPAEINALANYLKNSTP